ncbi:MAG TPA: HD domain-containing protein [Solirubrobacteraceae bacterium]|nr:HD domain-containing protein [Solirubrobacteraceae bacterium]
MNAALAAARAALSGEEAWLVGGAVRDRLLGRETDDVDLAVAGDARAAARRLARATDAMPFALSDAFGAWRVTARDRSWQADLMPLEGGSLEADLARRDFTVNAMAEPLAGGDLVDPFGGRADLEARRLRLVSDHALEDDPLRVMRWARLAVELGLDSEPRTEQAVRRAAPRLPAVAPERVFAELKRIVGAQRPELGIGRLAEVGALEAVLPELAAQRGVEQNRFHHLDVYAHTLEVLATAARLEGDPEFFGEHADAVAAFLAEPLADELSRAQALRLGALMHDVAKPPTRSETPEGRVTFMGHDALGAEMAHAALGRLRASQRLREHVAALTRHHLRAGFLVHRRPLTRRDVHAYLRACEPVEVDVTLLSVADRLATRGDNAEASIANHLEVARELLGEALRWRAEGPPEPLVRGDELAAEVGIPRGPRLGEALRELEAAQFAGEIASREDAVALARRLAGETAD